ncbi:MAG: translation initiation factor [Bacteroidales bacterium]|nr:translation initiation factor [Bacteroidales bacterium]
MSKQRPEGIVYSTNPDFQYQYDQEAAPTTLEPARQKLRVGIERHHRGGKTVTVVKGFVGSDDDLQQLGRQLKSRCGVGGSAKEGDILVQGELKEKVTQILLSLGYTATR